MSTRPPRWYLAAAALVTLCAVTLWLRLRAAHAPERVEEDSASVPGNSPCAVDADCVLSAYVDGSCCPALCGEGVAYTRHGARALRDRLGRQCDGAIACPVAKCPQQTTTSRAACRGGRCEVERVRVAE